MHGAFRLPLLLPTVTLLLWVLEGAAQEQNTVNIIGQVMATENSIVSIARERKVYVKRLQGRPALVQHEDQHDRRAFESSFSSYVLDTVHSSAPLRVDSERLLAFEKSPHELLLDYDKASTNRQASGSRQSPRPSPTIVAAANQPSSAAKKDSPSTPPGGWAVQVGSFNERENAALLRKKLQRAGFSAFEERVVSGGEPVFRVKVGPEASRSRAKALQAMLRNQEDLDGIVVSRPIGQGDVLAQAPSDQDAVDKAANDKSDPTVTGKDKKLNERLGEAPEEDFREVFVRESLVLLAPGEVQLEFSLDYLRDTFGNVRTREGSLFNTVRVGLPFGFEAFIDVPFSVREQEIFVDDAAGETTVIENDETGIGDIQAGLNVILLQESETWPSIIGTASLSEPTGEDLDLTDPPAAVFGPTGIALRAGRRSGTAGLSFVKSSDPAVLFGGLQFTYLDTDSVGGIEIQGGHQFGYRFGMGFAVNDELTMSGLFSGAYLTETELNGRPVLGSDVEPWSFRAGLTYAYSASQFIEPAISFAINEEAADAAASLAYVIAF